MSDGHAMHPTHQKHYFDSMRQQTESTKLGMWLFLSQEIMFFGGLFAAYTIYRIMYSDTWHVASGIVRHSLHLGVINTLVLILSSLTVSFAVQSARKGSRSGILSWLFATLVLASVFLAIKSVEYRAKFDEYLVPGFNFDWQKHLDVMIHAGHDAAPAASVPVEVARHTPPGIQVFFSLYFAMTGMHALHMIIGMGLIVWIMVLTTRGRFTPEYHPHVEYFGLYWHLVEIVWIFLFPLLYLA
ncbi:MAG: cytochrome c oxidase subunit 3 [Kiritimatiellia bacterium]